MSSTPTTLSLPRDLDTIPADILHLIGSHTDERTIWAMRATCRGWREPADKALQPYLKEKKVTVDPPLMIDAYTAIDILPRKQYTARKKQLVARHKKFVQHLEAYPASASQLQRLTVEIRDDDSDAGWRIMEEFASQLRHLEIHIFDRFFTLVDGDKQQAVDRERLQIDKYNKRSWKRLVDSNSSPPNQLPLLTSLNIHSTTRTIYHLNHIAPYVPNLQSLTLGEHWDDDYDDMEEHLTGPAFLQLERLSLIGSQEWTCRTLCGDIAESEGGHLDEPPKSDLLARSPNLCSLVIRWLSDPRGSLAEWDECVWELDAIMDNLVRPRWKLKRPLRLKTSGIGRERGVDQEAEDEDSDGDEGREGRVEEYQVGNDWEFRKNEDGILIRTLAIFGAHAESVLRAMSMARLTYPHAFSTLTDLVLEIGDASSEDALPMRVKYVYGNRHTHYDENTNGTRNTGLPALERICWVYRGRQRGSDGGTERVMPAGYDEAGFRELLDRYPSLQQVSCISDYPADPFVPIHPSDPNVICSVRRVGAAAL